MTRRLDAGAYRNLIGLKVSDSMLAAIESARGTMPVQDYLRGLIGNAPLVAGRMVDWERRATEAERKLELVRAALD